MKRTSPRRFLRTAFGLLPLTALFSHAAFPIGAAHAQASRLGGARPAPRSSIGPVTPPGSALPRLRPSPLPLVTAGALPPAASPGTMAPLLASPARLQAAPGGEVAAAQANAGHATPNPHAIAPLASHRGLTVLTAGRDFNAPAPSAGASELRAFAETGSLPGGNGILGSLGRVFRRERDGRGVFDGMGFRPRGRMKSDLGLDPIPELPGETEVPRVHGEGARAPGVGELEFPGSGRSIVLPGNPQDEAGVERALRGIIDANPELFGLQSGNLATVRALKVDGKAGLDDMIYVEFRQRIDSLLVEGTYLKFAVKMLRGRSVVLHYEKQLYPRLSIDTRGTLSERKILAKAAQKLGMPPQSVDELRGLGRSVMHLGGKWRAVEVYVLESKGHLVAVDVNSAPDSPEGAFSWDPRPHQGRRSSGLRLRKADEGPGVKGPVVENGGPYKDGVAVTPLPLGYIQIQASDGKTYYADAQGRFKVEGTGDQPVRLSVRLTGKWVAVKDQENKDLTVTVTAKPGEELRVVFNPEGTGKALANAVAQVHAYYWTTLAHEFLLSLGVRIPGLERPMPANVNINDDCNAYYTPWSPSINFFKASSRCVNSSYGDVVPHEYGHAADDAAGGARAAAGRLAFSALGIINGGLSEGLGDMLTMFITRQPIVGRGFIIGQQKDYIRHGENDYKYRDRDEVHAQGQAFMGFAWKLRKALIASLGEAPGEAFANALIVPVILAKARDIPAAIQHVLLRDIDADGNAPHFKEIEAAAAAHGIKVSMPKKAEPGVEPDSFWERLNRAGAALSSRGPAPSDGDSVRDH